MLRYKRTHAPCGIYFDTVCVFLNTLFEYVARLTYAISNFGGGDIAYVFFIDKYKMILSQTSVLFNRLSNICSYFYDVNVSKCPTTCSRKVFTGILYSHLDSSFSIMCITVLFLLSSEKASSIDILFSCNSK